MDWTTFYLGTAGAAATLMGLLFIGVQFRLGASMKDPVRRWQLIARSTFSMYLLLFVLPMIFLIPTLDNAGRASLIFILAFFGSVRAITAWLPVWRSIGRHRERLGETAWLLIGPLGAYLSLAYCGFQLQTATHTDGIQTGIALTFIGFFSIVLRNSWNLLVEVPDDER